MTLTSRHSVSFIYAVFEGTSTSLSSLFVGIFLFFDALLFLLFLVVFPFDLLSLRFLLKEKKTVKKNNAKISSLAKIVIIK